MTRHDIVSKIAEEKYKQRMRMKDEGLPVGGDAETDWAWAERAVEFFEAKGADPVFDTYKLDEFGWVGPLYYRLVSGGKEA